MSKFGWDLPPGVTQADIDQAYGIDEEQWWDYLVGEVEKAWGKEPADWLHALAEGQRYEIIKTVYDIGHNDAVAYMQTEAELLEPDDQ